MDMRVRKYGKKKSPSGKEPTRAALPERLIPVFTDRGVSPDKLKAFEYTDMDGEGHYADVWLAFDDERLYVVTGKDRIQKKKTRQLPEIVFDFKDFKEYPLDAFDSLSVERFLAYGRLMGVKKAKAEDEEEVCTEIVTFSLGVAANAEKFARNFGHFKEGKEIPEEKGSREKFCPKCGARYPNPDRQVCPRCLDKKSLTFRLLGFFKYYYKEAIIFFCFLLASAVFTVISPYIGTKMLYDDVLVNSGATFWGKPLYGEITFVILLIVGVRLLALGLTIAQNWVSAKIAPYMTYDLKLRIFSAMQRLSLSFYTSKQTGFLMERVTTDAQQVYWFFMDIVPYALINAAKFLVILVIMLLMDWKFTLVVVAIVPVIFVVWKVCRRLLIRNNRISWMMQSRVTSLISDTMNGQRIIKSFGKEDDESQRFARYSDNFRKAKVREASFHGVIVPALGMVPVIAHMVILALGSVMIVTGKGGMSFGELMTFVNYMNMLYAPIEFFSNVSNIYARCMDSAQRIFEVIDSQPDVMESEHPVPLENMKGDIEVKNVMFEYEPGRPVIKDLSLSVKAGHMVGIVGRTGAGKSTIVNLIARLYDVKEGSITIDGVNIKDIAFKDMKKNIGIVSQEIYLFSGSIADNIRYARPDASIDEVIAAAKAASAHDFIVKLPDGYETRVGAGGQDLSGGEKQRISIARTIIQNPRILILDEATAAMDTETERRIQESIHALQDGRTTIAIAHRLSTLRDADVLAVIDKGEMKEYGTHDQLIAMEDGIYHKLYTLQQEAVKHIAIAE